MFTDDAGTLPQIQTPYTSVFLAESCPKGPRGECLVPIGLPVTFSMFGRFSDGSAEVPSAATSAHAQWRVAPDDGSVVLRTHDGVTELTASRATSVQVHVTLQTSEGFTLDDSVVVTALAPVGQARLRAFTLQEGPWARPGFIFTSQAVNAAFSAFDSSGGPPAPAVAPVSGAARIVSAYLVTLDGHPGTARFALDPSRVTYATSGSASVTSDGVVSSPVPGDVIIVTSFSAAASTSVAASFVVESPAVALRLVSEGPITSRASHEEGPVESLAAEGSVTQASVLALGPAKVSVLNFSGTTAGSTTQAWLAARHGTEQPYFEWLSLSQVPHTVLERPLAYVASAEGHVRAGAPGVGLHVFSAQGLSIPVLIRVPYPVGAPLALRADPAQVTMSAGECRDIALWATPPGGSEAVLTQVEGMVSVTSPPLAIVPLVDAAKSQPLHLCAASTMSASRSTTLTIGYLGATTTLELRVPKGP